MNTTTIRAGNLARKIFCINFCNLSSNSKMNDTLACCHGVINRNNNNNNNNNSKSTSDHLGANPSLVAESLASARRVLSGAYSRQTLIGSRSGRDYSVQELHLAASCCIYGRQKWRSFTAVCIDGLCNVELLDKEFQPPGAGRLVSLGVGQSLNIPTGQAYYLRGQQVGGGQSRLLMVSVPGLDDDEVQDADGSYPRPPAVPPVN